ncbi:DUF805 domain-containing protein [Halomonas denitrificans]|uniref:DUF805 domain-containing protein n=1 Tax=Halomonas denitrificans TaxID=370769 RepID=UPI001CD3A4C4|nr:DUF805 domain-containing protein [Halomonas denitrificans]MCA0976519.1 DUF805 domain-containing protein [Halomonas denitrificans]
MQRPTASTLQNDVASCTNVPRPPLDPRPGLPGYWFDSISGRESRADFCLNAILALSCYYAGLWALIITAPDLHDSVSPEGLLVGAGWLLVSVYPLVLHGVRRLHDVGQRGHCSVMLLFPGANLLLTVVLVMQPGETTINEHGERERGHQGVMAVKSLLTVGIWVSCFFLF